MKAYLLTLIHPLFFSILLFILDFICILCWIERFYSTYDYFDYDNIVTGTIISKEEKIKYRIQYTVNIGGDKTNKDILISSQKKYAEGSVMPIRCTSNERYYFDDDSIYSVILSIFILIILSILIIFLTLCFLCLFYGFIISLIVFICMVAKYFLAFIK